MKDQINQLDRDYNNNIRRYFELDHPEEEETLETILN